MLLAPAAKGPSSEPKRAVPERREAFEVSWYCVVVEVPLHGRFEPFASSRHGIVHARAALLLDLSQLGPHALADRLASHGRSPDPGRCADMCKAQELERIGFVFCSSYPGLLGKPPELDPARPLWS